MMIKRKEEEVTEPFSRGKFKQLSCLLSKYKALISMVYNYIYSTCRILANY